VKWLLVGLIRAWRAVVSPVYGPRCKYYPSCSEYGLRAVEVHGALKGAGLAAWRIARCNPLSNGGYDPVPGTREAYLWEIERAGVALVGGEA
jgi:putative membrane protein insertion efficiency factor